MPNSSPQQIKERAACLVSAIRKRPPQAPIIIIPSIIREHGYWDQQVGKNVGDQNKAIRHTFEQLQQQGMKGLYLLSQEHLLGQDHEGTVDGTHPNDLGFDRMLLQLQPEIMAILQQYGMAAKD